MPDEALAAINQGIAAAVRGKKWIVASEAAVGPALVSKLRDLGAEDVMVAAAIRGVGELPADTEIVYFEREATEDSLMGSLRGFEAALAEVDSRSMAVLDAFDPDRSALVTTPPFFDLQRAFDRRIWAPRRSEWLALEDKMLADGIWDAAGVTRASSAIVDVAEAPAVASSLDLGDGTVWVADNTRGWHGGGEYTRWLRPGDDADALADWFRSRASLLRVMPFLEGIPCSIHGFATPRGIAAFRPFEMVVLRDPGSNAFVYAGGASFWDPPASDREQMREAARRVGAHLLEQVDYRGSFSIDGVMTRDGFRPTELNPRFSMGFESLAGQVEGLNPPMLQSAFVEQVIDADPYWLEERVVEAADAKRFGGMGMPIAAEPPKDPEPVGLRFGGSMAEVVPEGEAEGMLRAGSGPTGTYLQLRLDPDRVPVGPSVGTKAAQAVAVAGEIWGLPVPRAEAAPDVRG